MHPDFLTNKPMMGLGMFRLIILFVFLTFALNAAAKEVDSPHYSNPIHHQISEENKPTITQEQALQIASAFVTKESVPDIRIKSGKVKEYSYDKDYWTVWFSSSLKLRLKQNLTHFLVTIHKETGEIDSWGWYPDL